MPEKKTIERARRKKEHGDAPSTQAGEFVAEEMRHVKEGKHDVKSKKQAVAIGLSKARRAGVDLKPPSKGKAKTKKSAARAYEKGQKSGPLAGGKKRTSSTKTKTRKKSSTSRKKAASK